MINYIHNKELLEICKSEVASKFMNGDFNEWVNSDYIRLSDEILAKTKNQLSATSLKRIFGKVKSDVFPKTSTLDILVQYIDYKNWQEFIIKVSEQHNFIIHKDSEIGELLSRKGFGIKHKRKIAIYSSLIILIGLGFWFRMDKNYSFHFSHKQELREAPYNAKFMIDVSKIHSDNRYIDFNDAFETDSKFEKYHLSNNSQTVTHSYLIPGVYHPNLIVDNKIIDSLNIPVYSKGWEWVVVNYHEKSITFHSIKDKPTFRKNGIFCIPASEVARYMVDTTTTYCMRYMYYKDFKVLPENLEMEIKTCNPVSALLKCSDIEIQLKFLKWNIGFMLFHKGCNGNYSRVQMGSKVLNGIDHDLSMFEVDLNQWQTVLLKIKNAKATISINGKIVFESKIEGNPGAFQGISINSQQSAQIDKLRISSSDKVLLSEEY